MRGFARKGLVEKMTCYKVEATEDQGFWCLRIPQIERATQARSIDEINVMAKDLIRIMTLEEDVELSVVYMNLPPEVAEAVELKRQAAELEARAMATQSAAAKKLHELGVSLRDIGRLLGISHQRAHQLVKA